LDTASTSGCKAVDPEAVMLPATQLGPAPAAVDGALLAPLDCAPADGAGVVAALQAPMARAAMAARLTRRLAG
jgi:hypothetical protein